MVAQHFWSRAATYPDQWPIHNESHNITRPVISEWFSIIFKAIICYLFEYGMAYEVDKIRSVIIIFSHDS